MVDERILELICCPETQQELSLLGAEVLSKLNDLQASGELMFRNGQSVGYPLSGALLRADRQLIYPVREDIPVLLVEESILTENLGGML
jgi:uncharacterized protein YbaR (Trm112 family)